MVRHEAAIVKRRNAEALAVGVTLNHSALLAVPNMGSSPSATRKAYKHFTDLVKRLQGS